MHVGGDLLEVAHEPQRMIDLTGDLATSMHVEMLNHVFSTLLPEGDVDELRGLIRSGALAANECIGKGPYVQHTLLHWACSRGHTAQAIMLKEMGADLTRKDSQGRTPIQLAEKGGHTAVVASLTAVMESMPPASRRRSYEEVHGPMPRGPPIDGDGLAQQVVSEQVVSGPSGMAAERAIEELQSTLAAQLDPTATWNREAGQVVAGTAEQVAAFHAARQPPGS
jgi:hypothetical protein